MFVRVPTYAYQDPLERIWVHCAERIGFKIVRSSEAYASYDGKGHILIATVDQFDPDDNLGQMIFHELCHALVEGDEGEKKIDWGLDNTRMGNPWREHACLRAQAWLAAQWGLRDFFAPTTDYRVTFWENLEADPLPASVSEGGFRERSVVAARRAIWRSQLPRWHSPLQEAFRQTRCIADAVATIADKSLSTANSLWSRVSPIPAQHPSGTAAITQEFANRRCSECSWSFIHRGSMRCRHSPEVRLIESVTACSAFEARDLLDCLTCGACCREAYDSVEVGSRDKVRKAHPSLIVKDGKRLKMLRSHDRCAALEGDFFTNRRYFCSIYDDRPRTCRDFTRGHENCLEARRKVGMSL
jgi:Putative zinc- or iron-chelating domain